MRFRSNIILNIPQYYFHMAAILKSGCHFFPAEYCQGSPPTSCAGRSPEHVDTPKAPTRVYNSPCQVNRVCPLGKLLWAWWRMRWMISPSHIVEGRNLYLCHSGLEWCLGNKKHVICDFGQTVLWQALTVQPAQGSTCLHYFIRLRAGLVGLGSITFLSYP